MASERLQRPVLVLNASFEPINICAARRALVLVLKGVASAEEESASAVHSARAAVDPALGDPPARVSPHSPPDARPLAQEHPNARPLHLPVLPPHAALGRADPGSRYPPLASRRIRLGKPGGLLPLLQQSQGRPDARRGRYETRPPPRPFSLHTSRHLMRILGKSDAQWRSTCSISGAGFILPPALWGGRFRLPTALGGKRGTDETFRVFLIAPSVCLTTNAIRGSRSNGKPTVDGNVSSVPGSARVSFGAIGMVNHGA